MNHVDVLAALSSAEKADLTRRDTLRGLLHLAGHLGAIIVTGGYIAVGLPLWWLVLLPHGILLAFLFSLSHECTHQTPFGQGWLSDLVGHAIAPVLLLPFLWFRYFHLAHHRHTNDPENDPELAGGGRPATFAAWLKYLTGWGYWANNATTLWRHAFGNITAPYLPPRKHPALRVEARMLIALYAGLLVALPFAPLIFWLWLLPVLIGQPFLRLYLLAEHGLCPPVADMFENTRTTLTARAMRWLAWNMPYHAEHHAYPAVPFHRLPALHSHVAAHLKSVSPGYAAFTRDYLAHLDG